MIVPLLEPLGFRKEQILANRFVFDNNAFSGIDTTSPLAFERGKVKAVSLLPLNPRETINIGDGISDYQLREEGLSSKFIYYSEFVSREKVEQKADLMISTFDELFQLLTCPA
jgi:D-3-phosphoglycerate dehydrogenase